MPVRKPPGESSITILINRWERDLILRYGYPFEDIERQLNESGDADLARVTDAPYWWEQVIGNLHISEKENFDRWNGASPAGEVRALIERIAGELGLL
jgi:hypothetical protein